MLAGKVRLKTFVAVVAAGLGVGGLVLGVALVTGAIGLGAVTVTHLPEPEVEKRPFTLENEGFVPDRFEAVPKVQTAPAKRELDGVILGFVGQDLKTDKRKDVATGKPYKINVYQDAGSAVMNRAKVDLDRDDKWDEKWTIAADGTVTRQVAPADDEAYTAEYVWTGSAWKDTAAPEAVAAAGSAMDAASAAPGVREVDSFLLGWKGKPLGAEKKKDVTKGRAYKVNLYQDAGEAVVNRAKIDLDRDDKWDEKWTFDGETITRQVAPADDEAYTEKYHWSGQAWVPAG